MEYCDANVESPCVTTLFAPLRLCASAPLRATSWFWQP